MRPKMITVVFAVLVCCICYLLVIAVMKSSERSQTLGQDVQLAQRSSQEDIQFQGVASGEGLRNGIDTSFQSYNSSDGVAVLFLTQILSSADLAQQELQKRAQTAIKIVDKGVKLDREGKVVGERRVIVFSDSANSDNEMFAVLWTRKMDLLSIESRSMEHALAFEKQCCP